MEIINLEQHKFFTTRKQLFTVLFWRYFNNKKYLALDKALRDGMSWNFAFKHANKDPRR